MTTYATAPLNFFQLLKKCFSSYPIVFKAIWQWVLLLAALNFISTVAIKFNPYVGWAMLILVLLVNAFIFAAVLSLAHNALSGNRATHKEAIAVAKNRYLPLLGGYILFLALAVVLGIIDFSVVALGNAMNLKFLFVILGAIVVLFSLFIIFLLYFALPLIVLEKHTVFKSFENSAKLVWKHWWLVFGILLIMHIIVVGVGIFGSGILPTHDIVVLGVWNFIVQLIFAPLMIATILTILHDLKLRNPQVS